MFEKVKNYLKESWEEYVELCGKAYGAGLR